MTPLAILAWTAVAIATAAFVLLAGLVIPFLIVVGFMAIFKGDSIPDPQRPHDSSVKHFADDGTEAAGNNIIHGEGSTRG